MKRLVGLGGVLLCIAWAGMGTASAPKGSSTRTALGAPTYYIAAEVYDCEPKPNYVDFRGASNLPAGAVLTANVMNFGTWEDYGEPVHVTIDKSGFFAGKILPKNSMKLQGGQTLMVSFETNRPKQPDSVLQVLGNKGERLAEVENVSLSVPGDIDRPAVNPQLLQRSGDYYGLVTTSMIGDCGKSQ